MSTHTIRSSLNAEGRGQMRRAVEQEYLSVVEAAGLLGVSQSTVWRWIDHGELPAFRVGQRRIRLKRADVVSLITPARTRQEKGGRLAKPKRLSVPPLSRSEQSLLLAAVEEAKKLQAQQLKERGGTPFPSSAPVVVELREERTRDQQ